eukprot:9385787-Pyramimonas_sp.AAC.1
MLHWVLPQWISGFNVGPIVSTCAMPPHARARVGASLCESSFSCPRRSGSRFLRWVFTIGIWNYTPPPSPAIY